MNGPLDELYFTWLYSQIGSIRLRNRSKSYWTLARQLYKKEFVWIVPNDDNRAEDGRDLRIEFINDQEIIDVDRTWVDLGCSMLELMIGLSRRLAFEIEGEPRDWFWELVNNIGLMAATDASNYDQDICDQLLDMVINRTYQYDGDGGLFPLKDPERDQRKVELWYQLSTYIIERF